MHILEILWLFIFKNNLNATLTIFKNATQLQMHKFISGYIYYELGNVITSFIFTFFMASRGEHLWLVGSEFASQDY